MIKRKRLGQHFLTSQSAASRIIQAAGISKDDVVLEIGTGSGILVPRLCKNAKRVISFDADRSLYDEARKRFSFDNLELVHGDGFKTGKKFSIFVSSLPYSQSRTAIEWLSQKRFISAVIMVQKEFADKLFRDNRAVAVIANHCFDMQKVTGVGRNNFSPQPKVDSVVIKLTQRRILHRDVIKTVNLIFSYRRKTLSNILRKFGMSCDSRQRLDDLGGDEIIEIAKQINGR